jgi:hypothetical protein
MAILQIAQDTGSVGWSEVWQQLVQTRLNSFESRIPSGKRQTIQRTEINIRSLNTGQNIQTVGNECHTVTLSRCNTLATASLVFPEAQKGYFAL